MDKIAELGESYANGFVRKMAQAGVPSEVTLGLLEKKAQVGEWGGYGAGAGALGGAALGAILARPETVVGKDGKEKKKYHRLRNAILGAVLGGVGGGFAGTVFDNTPAGIRSNKRIKDEKSAGLLKRLSSLSAKSESGSDGGGEG